MNLPAELLITTYTCLLHVRLAPEPSHPDVDVLEREHGVYFGLTRETGGDVFCVARNMDVLQRPRHPDLPTNTIRQLSIPPHGIPDDSHHCLSFSGSVDLHQIRHFGGSIWATAGCEPELLVVNLESGQLQAGVPLQQFVPADLQHTAPEAHPGDRYHFNSIHFGRDRLFLLAHNWGYGSFVLEFHFPGTEEFLQNPTLSAVYRNVGFEAHDVFSDGNSIVVLDSLNGMVRRLSRSAIIRQFGESTCKIGRSLESINDRCPSSVSARCNSGQMFLRGLAADDNCYFVGHSGFAKSRENRSDNWTYLSIVDRRTLGLNCTLRLGQFGDTSDVLLLDRPDLTDRKRNDSVKLAYQVASLPKLLANPFRKRA